MPDFLLPKDQWGPGPWQYEPDAVRFEHAGLACYVFRHSEVTGSLNGYVAVPDTHPWWGKDRNVCFAEPQCAPEPPIDWDAMPGFFYRPPSGSELAAWFAEPQWHCPHRVVAIIEVHGGVTYSGPMSVIGDESTDGEAFAWGFGFDCGHAGDYTPRTEALLRDIYLSKGEAGRREWEGRQALMRDTGWPEIYRELAYVRGETERLAEQLALVVQTQETR